MKVGDQVWVWDSYRKQPGVMVVHADVGNGVFDLALSGAPVIMGIIPTYRHREGHDIFLSADACYRARLVGIGYEIEVLKRESEDIREQLFGGHSSWA